MLKPTTKWFSGYTSSKDELKSRYKELVKKYHPDIVGHDTEEIREINTEYDKLYDIILNGGVIPTFSNTKPSATPLVAYRIYLFIRNRYEETSRSCARISRQIPISVSMYTLCATRTIPGGCLEDTLKPRLFTSRIRQQI